jgi:hypothetical protein
LAVGVNVAAMVRQLVVQRMHVAGCVECWAGVTRWGHMMLPIVAGNSSFFCAALR